MYMSGNCRRFGRRARVLIARGKLWSHVEGGAQLTSGRNYLNSFLVFKSALFVMIGQAPARLDAKKRSAIGPQRQIRYAAYIDDHPASARRVDEGKLPPWNIAKFQDDRTGQISFRERHFPTGKIDIAGFTREIIVRRGISAIKTGRHLQPKAFQRGRSESWMQSKSDVGDQIRFLISKLEENAHFVDVDLVA